MSECYEHVRNYYFFYAFPQFKIYTYKEIVLMENNTGFKVYLRHKPAIKSIKCQQMLVNIKLLLNRIFYKTIYRGLLQDGIYQVCSKNTKILQERSEYLSWVFFCNLIIIPFKGKASKNTPNSWGHVRKLVFDCAMCYVTFIL